MKTIWLNWIFVCLLTVPFLTEGDSQFIHFDETKVTDHPEVQIAQAVTTPSNNIIKKKKTDDASLSISVPIKLPAFNEKYNIPYSTPTLKKPFLTTVFYEGSYLSSLSDVELAS